MTDDAAAAELAALRRQNRELSEIITGLHESFGRQVAERLASVRSGLARLDELEEENERLRAELDRERRLGEARRLARRLLAALAHACAEHDGDLLAHLDEVGLPGRDLPEWLEEPEARDGR